MTAITIRRLPEGVKQRLRMRAAENGRSMEAEARDILVSALVEPRVDVSWVDILAEAGDRAGRPDLIEQLPPRSPARVPEFNGPTA